MKRWLLWLCLCPLAGCASAPTSARLPYDAWRLGFSAPPYMEVWVETADVEDMKGGIFHRAGSGTVSIGYAGSPAEWRGPRTWGAGKYVTGADLPRRIYVRWQSLVEPQTYRVTLEIPESARKLMLTKADSQTMPGDFDYRKASVIGLAPGGIAKVSVTGPVGKPIEVLCQQAEVEPKGPSQGLTNGRYAYSFENLDPKAQQYLKAHAIPYDSWKCGASP